MAVNQETASWQDVREHLYCELATQESRRQWPADAMLRSIAGQFDVAFEVDDGDDKFIVTQRHLTRWKVSAERLAQTAGYNGAQVTVWDWPRVRPDTRLFQYPDKDTHWIYHILVPGCLLEHTDVPATPIILVPTEHKVFIAGSPDVEAQRLMLERCLELCRERAPLTKRPLAIDSKWKNWELLPDERNRLARDYRRAFGDV